MAAAAHSPEKVAKVPPYLAINAGLFDSVDHWSYRDLQKLAKNRNVSSAVFSQASKLYKRRKSGQD